MYAYVYIYMHKERIHMDMYVNLIDLFMYII